MDPHLTNININFDVCLESLPCHHYMTLTYDNFRIVTEIHTSGSIFNILFNNPTVPNNITTSYDLHLFTQRQREVLKAAGCCPNLKR